MSWIQVAQTQSTTAVGDPATVRYTVELRVVLANGIDRELFVFRTTDDAFSHVATLDDLKLYPNNKAAALADNTKFYRASSASVTYTSQSTAAQASVHAQQRLKRVNLEWGQLADDVFGGSETFIYDSEDP
jgi:hypothetical protein